MKYLLTALTSFTIFAYANAVDPETLPRAGVNVHWIDFHHTSSALPFTNALKHATSWGTYGASDLTLDAQGYPTELPGSQTAVSLIFGEDSHILTGDDNPYLFVWEGSGTISINYNGGSYTFDDGDTPRQEIVLPASAAGSEVEITIEDTDPSDYIRNVRLYLPGYDEEAGLWTDHYLEFLEPFSVLRFGWGTGVNTEASRGIEDWNDRRPPDYYTYGDRFQGWEDKGVAYEAMIELANTADIDIWICVPHLTTADFHEELATLLRDNLEPGRRVWVEYSNEVFNAWFPVHEDLTEEAQELSSQGDQVTLQQVHGRKAAAMMEVFDRVFSETDQRDQFISVLSGFTTDARALKGAADEIQRLGKLDLIDVFAIGPYFAPEEGELRSLLEGRDPADYPEDDPLWDEIMEQMMHFVDQALDPRLTRTLGAARHFTLGEYFGGKPVVAYEGGQHLFQSDENSGYLPPWIAPINRHPGMHDVYDYYIHSWEVLGGETMVFYSDYYPADSVEAFGLKEYWSQPNSEAPKLLSVLDWIEHGPFYNPSWWLDVDDENGARDTSLLNDGEPGIGWIYDENWPFLYSYSLASWLYVFTDGDPSGFFAYRFDSHDWIWASNAWGWYYDFNSGWAPFNPED